MTDFWTVFQAAEAWGASRRLVTRWLAEGRVSGAHKIGPMWLIPAGTPCPKKTTWQRGRKKPAP